MNCFTTRLRSFREGRRSILSQVAANPEKKPDIHCPYSGSDDTGRYWFLGALHALKRIYPQTP